MFNRFLISLNSTSGRREWWLIWLLGITMIIAWLAIALPWVDFITGSMVGIGAYNSNADTLVVWYKFSFHGREGDYYFLVAFFGIAIMKFGLLTSTVAGNFARGYQRTPPFRGNAWGDWVQIDHLIT